MPASPIFARAQNQVENQFPQLEEGHKLQRGNLF